MKPQNSIRLPLPRDDRGAALIAVLVLLMAVSLLAMSMAALSQLATLGTRGDADRLRSAYLAEGALNRAVWLLGADRALYGETDPGNVDYGEFDEERFLADGADREMDYYGVTVRYRILPGAGGVDVTGTDAAAALNRLLSVKAASDGDLAEEQTRFTARVQDYADSNDLLTDDGIFVLEHPREFSFEEHPHFWQHRAYGKVNFTFFANKLEEE